MSGKKCLRVAQIVSQRLHCISREIILVKQNMVVCWATRSLSRGKMNKPQILSREPETSLHKCHMIEHPFT